jgi:peptide/nickel transport system substrate-binding protein
MNRLARLCLLGLVAHTALGSQPSFSAGRTKLTLALEDSVRTFDPRQSVDANSQYVEDLVHCSLITFDAEGHSVPGIAAALPRWIKDDTLEISLRDGLRFSDGSPLTAQDVSATYQSLLTGRGLARSGSFATLSSIKVKDQKTLEFRLKEPDASFITNLVVGILPAKSAQEKLIDPLKLPTCGPYRLKSIDINTIVLEKNPQYSGSDAPKLELLELKIVKNEKTRFAKLQTGEIDLVQNSISRDTVKAIEKKNPRLSVIRRPGLKTTYLGFNLRDPLTGSLAVREAIAYAIQKQEIIDIILGGMATPANTLLPTQSPFYDSSLKPRTQDLERAKKILDAAGFPMKGEARFELSFKTTTDITRISVAKAIASQLKKVGIKVKVEPMEWGRFKQDVDAGRVQLWSLNWVGFKDPDIYRHAFATDSFPPNGANRGWYTNPALDTLLKKGRSTNNREERVNIYKEIQQLVDKDLPYVFLWHEDNFAVVNRGLQGFTLFADGRYASLRQAYFQ